MAEIIDFPHLWDGFPHSIDSRKFSMIYEQVLLLILKLKEQLANLCWNCSRYSRECKEYRISRYLSHVPPPPQKKTAILHRYIEDHSHQPNY